jgi:quercetin dioxygenase-like cupin family protein
MVATLVVHMKVRRLNEVEATRRTGLVFETQVYRKAGFYEDFEDKQLSVSEISFAPGERTADHKHTIRQILYVIDGEGIVASDDERYEVGAGDVVSIPPEETHWHGAKPTASFRHLPIKIADPEHGGTVAVGDPDGRRSE